MKGIVEHEFRTAAETISGLDASQVIEVADVITEAIRRGNQVFFMGNGGSSADAQHLAAELSGRYLFDRPGMPGVCLSNVAPITAVGNDYGYDIVFSRQIEAFARKGDVVIGLSTSGNSKNVILAFEKAKDIGAITVSFTGDGGAMKDMADYAIIIPSKETPHIQEGYLVAGHMMCGLIERNMFGRKAVLIDRDDTIAKDVPYCDDPDKLVLFKGVPKSIKRLNDAGYLVIIVTNQSGIGRGRFDESVLEKVHEKMLYDISSEGGHVDDIFFCPHHPDDGCGCRKPEIGMGIAAVKKYHIDVRNSFMIGNSDSDMEFGERLGCNTLRVSEKFTFNDAVDWILDGS
ncbi:MAG: HAD-IIIA family hydrolase [Thermoplasmata archaeon]|nr:HAD-IIIA family hydrolase [Thermoplasmata archaeon]